MIIYKDTVKQFVSDIRENLITSKMENQFQVSFGRSPGISERNSWNALSKVRDILEIAGMPENMIALEYQIPYNQNRIDCLLFGKSQDDQENIVLLELKQWSAVKAIEDEEGNFVETYTGGGTRKVAHPSQQVQGYDQYLRDFIVEFENAPPLTLFSCSYCPNYPKKDGDGLFDPMYEEILRDYPIVLDSNPIPINDQGMNISRALAIQILKYLDGHKDFYFPFLVMCQEYTPEDDDFVEIEPDEWATIAENDRYQTFQLWENLQDLDEATLRLMSKGFIERVTGESE